MRPRRWLPHPLASLVLWASWLVMNNTIDPAHVLLGAVLAVAVPLATRALWPDELRFRNFPAFARLLAVLLGDIVVANVQVARLILAPSARLRPAFVRVPLDLTNRYAVSALASMITLTPGTVSTEFADEGRTLIVHVLDTDDAAALVRTIKARYESPLMEIMQ